MKLSDREMDRYGLIGFPIEHSKSPELFRAAYHGRYGYDLIEAETFERAWDKFINGPYRAINVTAPFKAQAAEKAEIPDDAVQKTGAANILVRSEEGIKAYNSDYLGVRLLLERYAGGMHNVLIVGGGGAGKAAKAASESLGFDTRVLRHNELGSGAEADVIIFTLPRAAAGCELLRAGILIEANYRDPAFGTGRIELPEGCRYVPGIEWLAAQAISGYGLMTGETPDEENINICINLH